MKAKESPRDGEEWETVKSLNVRRLGTNKMRKVRKENDKRSSSTN